MNNLSFWVGVTDPKAIKKMFLNKLEDSGFTILNSTEHFFKPQGYTGLWLLGESHFAVHTFPEEQKTYIELSSCVDDPYFEFIKRTKTLEKINNHI